MLAVFFFGLLLASQSGITQGCRPCNFRGVLDCTKHGKEALAFEKETLFCSAAAACACEGTLLLDCPGCDRGPEWDAREKRRAEIGKWIGSDALRAHLGRAVPRIETERFQLVLDLPALNEGKKMVDPHVIAHRVAQDVEAVSRRVAEHFGIGPPQYFAKMRMWIWGKLEDHRAAMVKFLHSNSMGDFKVLGRDPVFSTWINPPNFDEVPEVRALFSHNASHMLLSNLHDQNWVGDIGGGWFDAGAGHWYEYETYGRTVNYCIDEASTPLAYHGGKWRAPLRERIEKEDGRLLPFLVGKSTGSMTLPEQALCWSFFDWLVHEKRESLNAILLGLKKKKPTEALFRETLGVGIAGAESLWRSWVKRTYPREGDEPLNRKPKQ